MMLHTDKEIKLMENVCAKLKFNQIKKTNLFDRLRDNETADQSALVVAAKIWRRKKECPENLEDSEKKRQVKLLELACEKMRSFSRKEKCVKISSDKNVSYTVTSLRKHPECENELIKQYVRRLTIQKSMMISPNNEELERIRRKEAALQKFISAVRQVGILLRVFKQMRLFAMEKGNHQIISTGIELEESVQNDNVKKDLLFDQSDYKNHQFTIPKWAIQVCSVDPEKRGRTDIQNLIQLMLPLKGFRKHSQKKQEMLAKIVRYERFDRRRVIIRKGHVAMSFYLIYSGSVGILSQGDEERAFIDHQAIVMKKGDYFGELALIRYSERSATVVCLERTEFFVIDKEPFFSLGIDKFSEEELSHRYACIRSLNLFQAFGDELCKALCDNARVMPFLSDKVIENDSSLSQFIYFVTKGSCYVLRLLDLSEQEKMSRERKEKDGRSYMSSPRKSPLTANSSAISVESKCNETNTDLLDLSSRTAVASTLPDPSSKNSSTFAESNTKDTYCPDIGEKSGNTISSPRIGSAVKEASKGRRTMKSQKQYYNTNGVKKRQNFVTDRTSQKYCYTNNVGLGVYLKVDMLSIGQAFGLSSILNEEDKIEDKRKFVMVSSGCEVLRLSVDMMKEIATEDLLQKIKKGFVPFPSDEELYANFNRYNKWRCFREQLVDYVADYRSNIDKVLKERSASIPKLLRSDVRKTRSPAESCKRYSPTSPDGKTVKKNISNCNSPTRLSDVTSNSRQTPFIQEPLITTTANNRTLVLTHGGSRLNSLQIATQCPLLNIKNNSKALLNYSKH